MLLLMEEILNLEMHNNLFKIFYLTLRIILKLIFAQLAVDTIAWIEIVDGQGQKRHIEH